MQHSCLITKTAPTVPSYLIQLLIWFSLFDWKTPSAITSILYIHALIVFSGAVFYSFNLFRLLVMTGEPTFPVEVTHSYFLKWKFYFLLHIAATSPFPANVQKSSLNILVLQKRTKSVLGQRLTHEVHHRIIVSVPPFTGNPISSHSGCTQTWLLIRSSDMKREL